MVEISVRSGDDSKYQLTKALLVYANSEKQHLVTIHPVHISDTVHPMNTGEESPQPRLGAGSLFTVEALDRLLESMEGTPKLEYLPERVLASCRDALVWYLPAGCRPLYFHKRSESDLGILSGRTFPHPPLLFKVKSKHLTVRALHPHSGLRPLPSDPVFAAPYWNVYLDGQVCLGTARHPGKGSVGYMEAWENSFFNSEFSHEVPDAKQLTTHPEGCAGLWKEMAGAATFPARYLVKGTETVERLISR